MITRTLEVGERVWMVRHTWRTGRVVSEVHRALFVMEATDDFVNVQTTRDDRQFILTPRYYLFDDWSEADHLCKLLN